VNENLAKGSFCLYHGDLSVAENEKAAKFLIGEVFDDLPIPFVIAGKNPPKWLVSLIESKNTTCLIANPNEDELQDLIAKAHINIVPSFNATGIKIKLINALFNGRFCLANENAVKNTGLEKACIVAYSASDFKTKINELYGQTYQQSDVETRHQLLDEMFNNQANARQMVKWIWPNETLA